MSTETKIQSLEKLREALAEPTHFPLSDLYPDLNLLVKSFQCDAKAWSSAQYCAYAGYRSRDGEVTEIAQQALATNGQLMEQIAALQAEKAEILAALKPFGRCQGGYTAFPFSMYVDAKLVCEKYGEVY